MWHLKVFGGRLGRLRLMAAVFVFAAISCTESASGGGLSRTTPAPTSTAQTGSSLSSASSPSTTHADSALDAQTLVDKLVAAGATVEAEGTVVDRFFGGGEGTAYCLNDRPIQVFSFSSEDDQRLAASTIDPDDPTNIGNAIVEWVAPPAFWGKGRIIVQYIGSDFAIREVLSDTVGPPVAADTRGRMGGIEPSCEDQP